MGPPKPSIAISQQAFDEMVKENIDDLQMDPTEALQDAIETLTLQGVDLSGIVTCKEDPVIRSLDRLKQLDSDWTERIADRKDVDEVVDLLDELTELCLMEGSGNAAIGTRNGGIELVCSVCSNHRGGSDRVLGSGLKALASLIHDVQSGDMFQRSGGPKMVMAILSDSSQSSNILNGGFSVVAAAATGNEIVKESFMELKIDELMFQILRTRDKGSIHSLYDAIRVLLTPDDNRVVYGYARRFAKIGIAEVLVDSLKEGLNSPSLVSATITLKAVAVNDEICRSIAESGGVDALLQCIDDSGEQGNENVARVCCSLLCKLAGSDANKSAIVQKGGMDRLIKLAARFSDDPSVLQEVMSIIAVLSLRSPDNAARAIEAGAGDLAIQAMQSFPGAHQMQRNACLMIRNLAVRNPENRQAAFFRHFGLFPSWNIWWITILLNNGIEKFIRKARENHESCNSAATDALRDLGLDDYNK
ncbi:hypothetical protein RHSIM_Rhsim05G0080700 [Rhododendron simsii]|uniref:Armadillo repeat-containing protein 6 n=1 Tax=Rhododendron simsii TaxID=118357 RepID=A0A834LPM9_RHOSS|nr:hypothetical protein RHSIM_Rhsim05G0080700 [Rhododendron simsii]